MGDISPPSGPSPAPPPFHVAIIGGGITGINLALGLRARAVPFTLYERAPGFREIGAGIGFSPNAEVAMNLLSPEILSAFKRVANPNGEDWFQFADGYSGGDELMYKLYVGEDGFQGCRRSDILEEWARQLPEEEGVVKFGREVVSVVDTGEGVELGFKDGGKERASVVVACDGIRSRVRAGLFPGSPAAFTGKECFRALVPMEKAAEAIGEKKAGTRWMYLGRDGHVITYPVGGNTLLNVLVVLSTSDPWPDETKHTTSGARSEIDNTFKAWPGGETVRAIAGLMPETMDKWGIFDMKQFPAPQYNKGAVCLAGDAAHATGPHLGAGGGLGIEDALVLAELMEELHKGWATDGGQAMVERALQAYNDVRYHRTQRVVADTRHACLLFHWQDEKGEKGEQFGEAITPMFHHVWEGDVPGMVGDASARLRKGEKED
ncbi:hypothetical protein B0T18DRAFT_413107 [Schizothecium vesticola]|uniref:FAD-binding domain-containing protein n=1 Tax=Schizothecium vesticola TaxID=314040 RepID=A0AA40EWZ3_9PEZI|nr:hypothetical protein B0T18DRAFT_413107 [Schizothecium vesticola]